jgi:hypothetical protein
VHVSPGSDHKREKETESKMGYMDLEGSGPSSAAKDHPSAAKERPAQDQPTFPPSKFVLPEPEIPSPEPEIPSSDSYFEVRCYDLILCILYSDMGSRTRVGVAVPSDQHIRLNVPSRSRGPIPRTLALARNGHCCSSASHLQHQRSILAAPPRR